MSYPGECHRVRWEGVGGIRVGVYGGWRWVGEAGAWVVVGGVKLKIGELLVSVAGHIA